MPIEPVLTSTTSARRSKGVQQNGVPLELDEPPGGLETDAAASKPFLKAGQCCFLTEDTTVNVLPTVNGKLLMAMGDGGFQYLLAGARASVGAKAGRYLFEVMIAEAKTLYEPQSRLPGPKPAQLVRIGVSTAESGLILGSADSAESVCFDSTGLFLNGRKREPEELLSLLDLAREAKEEAPQLKLSSLGA
eukprot:s874_g15.t1